MCLGQGSKIYLSLDRLSSANSRDAGYRTPTRGFIGVIIYHGAFILNFYFVSLWSLTSHFCNHIKYVDTHVA